MVIDHPDIFIGLI